MLLVASLRSATRYKRFSSERTLRFTSGQVSEAKDEANKARTPERPLRLNEVAALARSPGASGVKRRSDARKEAE